MIFLLVLFILLLIGAGFSLYDTLKDWPKDES